MNKVCSSCKTEKTVSNFYKNPGTTDGYGSWCKECDKINNRLRKQENKKKLVEYKGGKCSICSYSKCITALEFHHKDDDKDKDISKLYHTLKTAMKEVEKCILVCANCHREIHENITQVYMGDDIRLGSPGG